MKISVKKLLSCILVFTFILTSIVNMQIQAAVTTSKNETTIFNYLINDMDCNLATALGILANIERESGFNPTASVVDSNGLISYGICQWNGPRFELLKEYCSKNGYDYKSLSAQLNYLKYELQTTEKRAWSKMQGIDNTQEGAYQAGYNWARYFERCASVYYERSAIKARDVYWPEYYSDNVPIVRSDKSIYSIGEPVKLFRNSLSSSKSYQVIVTCNNKQVLSVKMSDTSYVLKQLPAGQYSVKLIVDQSLSGVLQSQSYSFKVVSPFKDVKNGAWYYDYVNDACRLGLMTGATDTLFKPDAHMNRAMVAVVFHRMEGSKSTSYKNVFTDVKNGEYYSSSVVWAKNSGVINGYKDGTFRPLNNITREEMATMIANLAKYKGENIKSSYDISSYDDYNSVSSYAKSSLQWAVENKIISGKYNKTKLDPQGYTTRAEASKMLTQAFYIIYN